MAGSKLEKRERRRSSAKGEAGGWTDARGAAAATAADAAIGGVETSSWPSYVILECPLGRCR